MDIKELENQLTHLRYRSSEWWRSACQISGLRVAELLELIGDENEDPAECRGIDVDGIIAYELGAYPDL